MSRRFSRIGVDIPAARLRQLATGAATSVDEVIDVRFALLATETGREKRLKRHRRSRQRGVHCVLVVGMALVALNLLACLAFIMVTVLLHETPF